MDNKEYQTCEFEFGVEDLQKDLSTSMENDNEIDSHPSSKFYDVVNDGFEEEWIVFDSVNGQVVDPLKHQVYSNKTYEQKPDFENVRNDRLVRAIDYVDRDLDEISVKADSCYQHQSGRENIDVPADSENINIHSSIDDKIHGQTVIENKWSEPEITLAPLMDLPSTSVNEPTVDVFSTQERFKR